MGQAAEQEAGGRTNLLEMQVAAGPGEAYAAPKKIKRRERQGAEVG